MTEQTPLPALPPLSEARVERMETTVFDRIAKERRHGRERRRRGLIVGLSAAAVIVLAAVIAPSVVGGIGVATNESAVAPAIGQYDVEGAPRLGDLAAEDADATMSGGAESGGSAGSAESAREIVTTGYVTIAVSDVRTSVQEVSDLAADAGGYVESMSVGSSGLFSGSDMTVSPVPPGDSGWVQVRIPSDALTDVVEGMSRVGAVTSSEISRTDVTMEAVDLRARVDAAQASVDRLAELLAEADSVSDLLAAESALAERQATLESQTQQLEMLESQVSMSSLSVQLMPRGESVEANPAGFADGLLAGWNGLVATLNGIVVALGFLLPWLGVGAVAALVVGGIVRLVRRRRTPTADPDA